MNNKMTLLSQSEREKRKKAIDFARGSCALEGIVLIKEVEELNQQYIDGQLTSEEHTHLCFDAVEKKFKESSKKT